MVEITCCLTDIEGQQQEVTQLLSLELLQESDAPCDALRVRFLAEKTLPEMQTVSVMMDGNLVFFGYCDYQSEERTAQQALCYIYARSSACLLLDNEAVPQMYQQPTAEALFLVNAAPFGFRSALPACQSVYDYAVRKGASCYGAVNDFLRADKGKNIRVSPDGTLYVPAGEAECFVPRQALLSESRCIRRSNAVSEIRYQLGAGERYSRHIQSRYLTKRGIRRSRLRNLASLPAWQQENALQNTLEQAAQDYEEIQLKIAGIIKASLYDSVRTEDNAWAGYSVSAIRYLRNQKGDTTHFVLRKQQDLEAIRYVVE